MYGVPGRPVRVVRISTKAVFFGFVLVVFFIFGIVQGVEDLINNAKEKLSPPTPTTGIVYTYVHTSTKIPAKKNTSTPWPMPTAIDSMRGCVNANVLNVRESPDKNSQAIDSLILNECKTFTYRSRDKLWLKFSGGWVFAQYIILDGPIEILPGWVD